MRLLLITLLLLLAGGPLALAASPGVAACAAACSQSCGDCAKKCGSPCKPCNVIEPTLCVSLPGAPCLCLKHKCATPLYPCGDYCIPETCHKAPVTCYPCGEACVPQACHKPATPVGVEFCCECQPSLTGSRDLIVSSSGCSWCAKKAEGSSCAKVGACSADGWSD